MPTPRNLAHIAAFPALALLAIGMLFFAWGFMALGDFISGRE